jgi:hypothetical protein
MIPHVRVMIILCFCLLHAQGKISGFLYNTMLLLHAKYVDISHDILSQGPGTDLFGSVPSW